MMLESVQHKFLRTFMYRCNRPMHFFNHDYTFALQLADIQTIFTRHSICDLTFLYSIINKFVFCNNLYDKIIPLNRNYSLRFPSLFVSEHYKTNFYYPNTIQRIIRLANTSMVDSDLLVSPFFSFKRTIITLF